MKFLKILTLVSLSQVSMHLLAQSIQFPLNLNGSINSKVMVTDAGGLAYFKLEPGSTIILEQALQKGNMFAIQLNYSNRELYLDFDDFEKVDVFPTNVTEWWKAQALRKNTYASLSKNGIQYDLRKELEEDILTYIKFLETKNMVFEDPYIEDLIYRTAQRLYPVRLNDHRTANLNVILVKDNTPNAGMAANGSLFIHTGLLSIIQSEEELTAIIAHEIAHFVLDHSVMNINEIEEKIKKAEFWSSVATTLAAFGEVAIASNDPDYMPGAITAATATAAALISTAAIENFGMKYSQYQESAADGLTRSLLSFLNEDPAALSSALARLRDYEILNGNFAAFSSEGTHPNLNLRIGTENPKMFKDVNYDLNFSLVNTFNAKIELSLKHFEACKNLVERNIAAGVAEEIDYILASQVELKLTDSPETNEKALNYLKTARSLNVNPNVNLYKQEAFVYLRLEKNDLAINSLKEYSINLQEAIEALDSVKQKTLWYNLNEYYFNEKRWTASMIHKIGRME